MSDPGRPQRLTPLTDDLRALLEQADGRPTTLQALLDALEERGTSALIVLIAAPFVLPVPLPGLSLPFGLALAGLGIRAGAGARPWLPAFLRRREIEARTLEKIVRSAERMARPVERRLRPRWPGFFSRGMCALTGTAIVLAAIVLIPPFPMPGINALPALAMVLMALGMMERDGAAVAAGYLTLCIAWAYLYLWWDVANRALRLLPF
jgi:hypothetical protein